MNINRNNYEEFFLLYVDNELSAADRKAVELFVQNNADLKAELQMLQQTVFNGDTVLFDDKESLLKEEITALQQNLLLYMDNELTAEKKVEVEQLLKADTAASKELALLQQTKLQADTAIVFAAKKSLYRKEGGRVIALPWRRIAAAAILLGFGTWATLTFVNTNRSAGNGNGNVANAGTATKSQTTEKVAPANTLPQQPAVVKDANATVAKNDAAAKPPMQKNVQMANTKSLKSVPEKQDNNIVVVKDEIKKPNNNLPQPVYNNFNKAESNPATDLNVTSKSATTENINSGLNTTVVETVKPDVVVNGYALNANYTEDSDNNLSPENNKGKKSKLGGFIRKVKRLVERNTEDPLSGKGIKVAGFDIAIK